MAESATSPWWHRLTSIAKVAEVLTKRLPRDKAVALATALTEGRWTHDFPITVELARQLGFPVSTNMPRTVYDLMNLYPQESQGPAVGALRSVASR